jgi:hypothetical protein
MNLRAMHLNWELVWVFALKTSVATLAHVKNHRVFQSSMQEISRLHQFFAHSGRITIPEFAAQCLGLQVEGSGKSNR